MAVCEPEVKAGDKAQLAVCLPGVHGASGAWSLALYKLDMIVVRACEPSTVYMEEEEQECKAALIHGDL